MVQTSQTNIIRRDTAEARQIRCVVSGMRPTGALHLGHYCGALQSWVDLQTQAQQCFFMVADLHALTTADDVATIAPSVEEMVRDWLAVGIDPTKAVIFRQSAVPAHAELALLLAMHTPLSWLERNPTYKEQLKEITSRDLKTYGFLGYPVLQAADILLYKATVVPIGEDQIPHLELTREIARRFNYLYKTELFPDCEALLSRTPRLLGIDGRKMSKSYDNAIYLSDSKEKVRAKVQRMFTDPQRIKMTDPGHPEECNVYSYYQVFVPSSQKHKEVYDWCSGAKKGCTECKGTLADHILNVLGPLQEKREKFLKEKNRIKDLLNEGAKKAKILAQKTMAEVREAVF